MKVLVAGRTATRKWETSPPVECGGMLSRTPWYCRCTSRLDFPYPKLPQGLAPSCGAQRAKVQLRSLARLRTAAALGFLVLAGECGCHREVLAVYRYRPSIRASGLLMALSSE